MYRLCIKRDSFYTEDSLSARNYMLSPTSYECNGIHTMKSDLDDGHT